MKRILAVLLVLAMALITPAVAESSNIADALDRGGSLNIVVKIDGFDNLEDCALRCDIQPAENTRVDLNLRNAGEDLLNFSAGNVPGGAGMYVQASPLGDKTIVFNKGDLSKTTGEVGNILGMLGMVSGETASNIEAAANSIDSGKGKIDLSNYDLSPLEEALEELSGRCVRETDLRRSSKYSFFASEEKAGEAVRRVTISASRAEAQYLVDAFRDTVAANPQLPDWSEQPLESFAGLLDSFVEKLRGSLTIDIDLDADDIPVSVVIAFALNQEDGVRTYTLDGKLNVGAPLGEAEIVNPIYPAEMDFSDLIKTGIEMLENVGAWIQNLTGRFGAGTADVGAYDDDLYAEDDPYADDSEEESPYGDISLGDLFGSLLGGTSGEGSTYGGTSDEGFSLGDLFGGLLGGTSGEGSTYGGTSDEGFSLGDLLGGSSDKGSTYGGTSDEGFSLGDLLGGLLGGSTGGKSTSGSSAYGGSSASSSRYGSSTGEDFSISDLLGSLFG